jgi:hypothetical protein
MEVSCQLNAIVDLLPRETAPNTSSIGGWVGLRVGLDAVVEGKIPSSYLYSNLRPFSPLGYHGDDLRVILFRSLWLLDESKRILTRDLSFVLFLYVLDEFVIFNVSGVQVKNVRSTHAFQTFLETAVE